MQEPGIVGNRGTGGGERQNGVAQVRPGEVADVGPVGRTISRRNLLLARPADHPDPASLGREALRQLGVIGCGPALGWPDRARRKRHHRPAVGCEPQPLAPRRAVRSADTLSSGQRPLAGGFCTLRVSASVAQRSTMRGSRRSPKRRSLTRPKRASPTKPVRRGIPASAGANADFQVRGMISACAVTLRPQPLGERAMLAEGQAGCAAGRPRSPCARPACSRAAARPSRSSAHRPAGPEIADSAAAQPCGSERSRRSTCRARAELAIRACSLHGRLAVHRAPFVLRWNPTCRQSPKAVSLPLYACPVRPGRPSGRSGRGRRGVPESCTCGRSRAKEARAGAVGTDVIGHRRGWFHRLQFGR